MTAEELRKLLQERPFKPLRLHLADGRTREIRHPEMALVSESLVAIGLPRDEKSAIAVRLTFCSLPNIVEADPIDAADNGDHGKKRSKKRRDH